MSSDDLRLEAYKAAGSDEVHRADYVFVVTYSTRRAGDCEWAGSSQTTQWTLQVMKSRDTKAMSQLMVIPPELGTMFTLIGKQLGHSNRWVVCLQKVKPLYAGVPAATMPADFVETSVSGMVNAFADEMSKLAAKKKKKF